MPQVDLAFRLTGNKVPVDHGYALYSALSRILPEIHGTKNLGVLPIRGTYSGDGELMLRALSKRDVSRPCQRGVKESEMPKGVEHVYAMDCRTTGARVKESVGEKGTF